MIDSCIPSKAELRRQIKSQIPVFLKNNPLASEEICDNILKSSIYKKASAILAYMSLPDEVDLSKLLQKALEDGKKIFIPRIFPDTSEMDFFTYNPVFGTQKGSFGIEEPLTDCQIFEIKKHEEQILVLTPGRAFSEKGERLGRGKGFYDKYLTRLKTQNSQNLIICGVCFSFQVLPYIPSEPHDILMKVLITEKGETSCVH